MSVQPSGPSGGTPSSKGNEPEEGKKAKRDFKLPKKEEDEGEKKKKLLDMAGGEFVRELKQSVEQEQMAKTKEASEVQGTEAKAAVQAISRLIQRLVTEMRAGENTASMTLSAEAPAAFAGSNLTVSYQENALIIRFDQFMTPQQENNALTLVEKNKEQLLEMVQALQARNISVHEMSIGNHVIALPRVEPLPPPFQPPGAGAGEARQQREKEREGGEEGGAPQ